MIHFRENSTLCERVTLETVEFYLNDSAEFNELSRNSRLGGYQGYSMSGKDTFPDAIFIPVFREVSIRCGQWQSIPFQK